MSDFDYITSDLDDMSNAKNYSKWIISLIKPYIGDYILEVGAGCGNFTQVLLEVTNSKILTIEPSKKQFNLLLENLANHKERVSCENIFSNTLVKNNTSIKFDTIIYNNVLEHIEYDVEELKNIKKLLKPNGHIVIYSPALPFLMSEFDKSIGHFHRYTKKEILQKINQAGYTSVKFTYVDFIGVFLWLIKFKLLKSKRLGVESVKIFDSIIVPIISGLEKIIPIPIGKNVLVIAK